MFDALLLINVLFDVLATLAFTATVRTTYKSFILTYKLSLYNVLFIIASIVKHLTC